MDNMINGIIGGILFVAFSAGLAVSIHEPPFSFIVAIVSLLLLVDIYQSSRQGLAEAKAKRERNTNAGA